ncbi:MAG: hypothetical protein F6K14_17565 [Symploca sp. SIO2C1]|nr:hypothetical protein [Symploca sp. SIO2C1]
MPDESMKNEQSVPFSGELELEDLEFLSDQQAEMIDGGFCFGMNGSGGGGYFGMNGSGGGRRRKGKGRRGRRR